MAEFETSAWEVSFEGIISECAFKARFIPPTSLASTSEMEPKALNSQKTKLEQKDQAGNTVSSCYLVQEKISQSRA